MILFWEEQVTQVLCYVSSPNREMAGDLLEDRGCFLILDSYRTPCFLEPTLLPLEMLMVEIVIILHLY